MLNLIELNSMELVEVDYTQGQFHSTTISYNTDWIVLQYKGQAT